MESNLDGPRPSAEDAAAELHNLVTDRQALADGVRVPWSLLAGLGGVAAWWVAAASAASPGEDYEAPTSGWLGLVAVLVIGHLIRNETGIRIRKMGGRAALATVAIVLICLVLFSVSLALVSLGATWAVVLTSLSAFGLVTWLAGIAYRSALDAMRRG
ncbi:PAM68 family protein [Georgenia sp. EYE_87]|uniref:PAM68 family protein n=1 Tax=Georgenia sp. EYE_87 TaxID=2853448 RepID=UPI0020040523|nr:PAM68 family protein [Georgenia sp. EYE_87]MCK6209510.1 PAM68 family protein [Georgenia sp. EYE_87]